MAHREWINYWAPRRDEADQDDEHPLLPTVACTFGDFHYTTLAGNWPIYCWGRPRRNFHRVWAMSNMAGGPGPFPVPGRRGRALRFTADLGTGLLFLAETFSGTIAASTLLQTSVKSILVSYTAAGVAPTETDAWRGDYLIGDGGGFFALTRTNRTVDHDGTGTGDRIWAYNWDGDEDALPITYSVGYPIIAGMTHDGTTLRAFKDGALVGSMASGPTSDMTGTLFSGRTGGSVLEGDIDFIYLWDRVLSPAQMHYVSQYPYCFFLEKSHNRFFVPAAQQAAGIYAPWIE